MAMIRLNIDPPMPRITMLMCQDTAALSLSTITAPTLASTSPRRRNLGMLLRPIVAAGPRTAGAKTGARITFNVKASPAGQSNSQKAFACIYWASFGGFFGHFHGAL
ncbi:hypothetical protein QBC36DRAFT_2868 [Triangularia setosa]|uniref:Uncharacterized protein n=1 Tax=Triangularia setosa TaxID=2587417 RepID=A0AAN6WIG0_9PEZI|nr:hypothetical protein QBC36DRAFT_2868 [Podospora setosa]